MTIVRMTALALLALTVGGCSKNGQEQQAPPQQQAAPPNFASAPATSPTAAGGIRWKIPGDWTLEADRPMRVATYSVPAASGDAEGGECAAYYFGSDQGGDVQSNVDRWATQFENPTGPTQTTSEIAGMKVTNVVIAGSYLAPGGPMMQSQGKKDHYKLLGAIVEAPQGRVFFKFTGPEKTVDAAKATFESLLASMTKE
jgi:hypothetical protein